LWALSLDYLLTNRSKCRGFKDLKALSGSNKHKYFMVSTPPHSSLESKITEAVSHSGIESFILSTIIGASHPEPLYLRVYFVYICSKIFSVIRHHRASGTLMLGRPIL